MILVTGGTNFVGRSVLKQLTLYGHSVRSLLRPSKQTPKLPHGIPVDVTLAALTDRRGIRASLVGIDTVVHIASITGLPIQERQLEVEVEGTRTLAEACAQAGIKRLIYVGQIGADRSSAYVEIRARANAEHHVRTSGLPFTILRSTILFGREDLFTVPLAQLLSVAPLFFPIPGDGSTLLQPLWVEDLATCVTWILDDPRTVGETFEIGGPEYLSFRRVLRILMRAASSPRILFSTRPPYLRIGASWMQRLMPQAPISPLWVDYLAVDRTTDLNTLPSVFGLQPSRMEDNLSYLQERNWGWDLLAQQFSGNRGG
ncbi:MAG: NAD(P)H-binding protein [Anaerolineales bacterium]|nr:NAD(P)H-binding protein [Anaerolineales bacterium]